MSDHFKTSDLVRKSGFFKKLVAGVVAAVTLMAPQAEAAFFSYPKAVKQHYERMAFETPSVAPFSYTHFCLRYTVECRVHGRAFRKPRKIELTQARWSELQEVNSRVNRAIVPQLYNGRKPFDTWRIAPTHGDCNDYAVTKRHELLAKGWPSRALILAEVVTSWGEHHLVLVVRTASKDVVLDNLNPSLREWTQAPYQWVRAQSPNNPKIWSTVSGATV